MDNNRHVLISSSKLRRLNGKRIAKAALVVGLLLVPVVAISRWSRSGSQTSGDGSTSGVNRNILASTPIGVELSIPVPGPKKTTVGNLTMMVEAAEKRDEILVKGQKANAAVGRDFLILNIKIVNPLDQGVGIKTWDYFRLNANGSGEWLAPEIHNDDMTKDTGVEVQAISTKTTRVGFPINETDTNLILQIGPINGEKQQVPLNF